MSDAALQVQIDAAKAYEQLFVPALFAQWASTSRSVVKGEPEQE